MTILVVALIELSWIKKSPFTEFPSSQKYSLLGRCLAGQTIFFLLNYTLSLVPLTYQLILFQTGTFWTSILADCAFS